VFLAEPGAQEVEQLWNAADSVLCVSVGYLEVRSAIARRLAARPAARARALLEDRWQDVETRIVDDRLIGLAGSVVDRHRLRALDALHLATALDERESELVFVSWDDELRQAAETEGLTVAP
jgi:predicted nucleic acid-binding protein